MKCIGNFILVDDTIIQQYGKKTIPGYTNSSFLSIVNSVEPTNNLNAVAEGLKNKNKNKTKRTI